MKCPTRKNCRHLLFAAMLPVLPIVSARAQTAGEVPKDSETVVLSPFVVSTSSDVGYEASSSLAGTGLNTKLTDLGASVSVVTARFLEDTGSTNLKDLLVYQTNMETKGFGGNLSGATPSLGGITGEPSLSNSDSSSGNRVRGLADATLARNFYRSVIPMDSYNTDRVEINRGANALLFGVGSPAGIINTSTSAAELYKTFGNVGLSAGSYGSWRASLDANVALMKDVLAFRVAAVKDNEKFQQEFAHNDTKRVYAAGAWDIKQLRNRGILTSTTLRANYERGDIKSNNPRVLTPLDRLSTWFPDTLSPALVSLGALPKVGYDPTNGPFNVFNAASHNATVGVIANVNRSPTIIFQDVNATTPRDNIPTNTAGQTVIGRPFVSNNAYFPSTGKTGVAVGAQSRETIRVLQDYAFPDASFYTSENLSDPTIFNFFDNLLSGPNEEGISHLEAANVSLQQLFLDSHAGIEVSYDRQRWNESLQSLMSESSPYISIDVNTRMWTGEANPNFGRPFISTAGGASYNQQQVETTRAKLFYELDLQQMLGNKAGGILGKHVFSALAQREKLETDSRSGGSMFYTPDTWTNGNNQSRAAAQSKQIVTWVYLGPSAAAASTPSGLNLPGLQQNLMNFQNQLTGSDVVIARVPAPSAGVAAQPAYNPSYTPLTILRENREVTNTATSATLNERTLDSKAFTLQSNWLWNHLISTVGWRKESSSIIGVNAPSDAGGEGYVLVNDPTYTLNNPDLEPQTFDKTLFAWSAVAKAPDSWLKHVPVINALNAFYGTSENFSPPSGRTVDAFGRELAPPGGETKEQGIYVETFHGRLTARLNFFETTQTGSFNGTVGNLAGSIVSIHTQVYNMVHSGLVADSGNGFPVNYVAPPQALLDLFNWKIQNGTASSSNPGVRDTSDFVTKGKELEVMFRATRGLSFLLNFSQQNSVRSNTGAATRELLFNTPTASGKPIATEWLSNWAYFIPLNAGALGKEGSHEDQNILANNFQKNVLNPFNTAVAADGSVATELRKYHANFVGNYEFQEGRLKGFGLGTGVRWMSKAAIGYPVATFEGDGSPWNGVAKPTDIRISDVHNPIYGPAETRYDAWLSYKTNIWHGKVGLKVQLNVRNLFTHNELVPVIANPDGTTAVWAIAEGRKFTLSTKFSF